MSEAMPPVVHFTPRADTDLWYNQSMREAAALAYQGRTSPKQSAKAHEFSEALDVWIEELKGG